MIHSIKLSNIFRPEHPQYKHNSEMRIWCDYYETGVSIKCYTNVWRELREYFLPSEHNLTLRSDKRKKEKMRAENAKRLIKEMKGGKVRSAARFIHSWYAGGRLEQNHVEDNRRGLAADEWLNSRTFRWLADRAPQVRPGWPHRHTRRSTPLHIIQLTIVSHQECPNFLLASNMTLAEDTTLPSYKENNQSNQHIDLACI
jgi:hypothetical protein